MKKLLTTLIYASLGTILIGLLFKVLHWRESERLLTMGFWSHILAYLLYSSLVKVKDSRIVIPLLVLVMVVLASIFKVLSPNPSLLSLLMVVYISYHLFTKDYLGKTDIPFHKIMSGIGLGLIVVGVFMKIMQWPGANVLYMAGCVSTAFVLLLTGATKDLVRKK